MLAHAATAQGMRAVNHICGKKDAIRMEIMPAAVFTNPEVAGVGLTSDQCDSTGIIIPVKDFIVLMVKLWLWMKAKAW